MVLQRDSALGDEGLSDTLSCLPDFLTLLVCLRLGQAETEDDDQHRRTGTKPEQLRGTTLATSHARQNDRGSSLDAIRGAWC